MNTNIIKVLYKREERNNSKKYMEEISRHEDLMKELLVAIGKYFMNEEKKGK